MKNDTTRDGDINQGGDAAPDFKPLTAQEAQALRGTLATVSLWRVVAAQAVAGLVVCALSWALTGQREVMYSALCGACTAVVPQAIFAYGIGRWTAPHPGWVWLGFWVWEFVKMMAAVLILGAVAVVVPNLSWPALLVAMIVCLKTSWLAPLLSRQPKRRT